MAKKPWDVFSGKYFSIRVWENEFGSGTKELKADIYCQLDGSSTQSVQYEKLLDIYGQTKKALKAMHKHRVRQLWRNLFR